VEILEIKVVLRPQCTAAIPLPPRGPSVITKAICRDGNANSLLALTHNPAGQEVDLSRINHLAGTVRWTHASSLPSSESASYGTTNGRLDRNTLAMLDDGGAGRGGARGEQGVMTLRCEGRSLDYAKGGVDRDSKS